MTQQSSPSRFQSGLGIAIYAILLGIVVAIIADCYEIAFKWVAHFLHNDEQLLTHVPQWVLYGISPFLALPIIYFILRAIPEGRAHNISDLITGIHVNNGAVNSIATLLTACGAAISVAFGYSVGYYAPTVQIGAGLGALFQRIKFLSPHYAYISIGAGAAAAIAAIFHSPFGAVVFVHEVLFRFFSVRAFAPVAISAVTAYVVSKELFGKVTLFTLEPIYRVTAPTYIVAAIAGVLAAAIGVLMLRSILLLQQKQQSNHVQRRTQLAIAATLTAILTIAVPEVSGSNLNSMSDILNAHSFALALLAAIFVAKLAATIAAFGYGVPGGIFGPCIFIGAALGSLIAEVVAVVVPGLADMQQIIIITTMAAMLSSVLGSPIAMVLIAVEITAEFHLISVVMLAVVMANLTAYRLIGTSSFFDIQLKSRGFDFDRGRERIHAENQGIRHLLNDTYLTTTTTESPKKLEQRMIEGCAERAYIINDDGKFIGVVSLLDIERTPECTMTVGDIMHADAPHLFSNVSLWQAMNAMTTSNNNYLPVLDAENNTVLLGVIESKVLLSEYFAQHARLRNAEHLRAKSSR